MTASLYRTPADPDDAADIATQRRELVVEAQQAESDYRAELLADIEEDQRQRRREDR